MVDLKFRVISKLKKPCTSFFRTVISKIDQKAINDSFDVNNSFYHY